MGLKTTIIDMLDFGCVSCARAIEHAGRRVEGVHDVRVDLAAREIRLVHDESAGDTPAQLVAMINRIGHEARVREAGASGGNREG
jgi:cation transport ATPase